MLDYKSIIFKRYSLGLNYKELTKEFNASKSEINEFVCTFEMYEKLSYPLPEVFTNCYTTMRPAINRQNTVYEQPDFIAIFKQINERKNMTLVYLWIRYQKYCTAKAMKPYQYR